MSYVIPVLILTIVIVSLFRKAPTYTSFTEGVTDGLHIIVHIFPAIAAIIIASYMLRASGAIDMLTRIISPVTTAIGIPPEVVPLAVIRPVSGSGTLGILTDLLNTYGADTEIGMIASVITGSTETTFYCICVYFAQTRVKRTAKVIPCAVIGDVVGMIIGTIFVLKFTSCS